MRKFESCRPGVLCLGVVLLDGNAIAETAEKCLRDKWGYIWGKSGVEWTAQAQAQIEKTTDAKYETARKYGSKWIGHKVADCSGLVVYCTKQNGIKGIPHGSNSMWKMLTTKGKLPYAGLLPGMLVFKERNNGDYYHVGIYTGNGEVIEAQGTQSGVIKSPVSAWHYWGAINGLSYASSPENEQINPVAGVVVVDVPNDGTVNIRNRPSKQGKIIETLREGETVNVLAVSGEWATVEFTQKGYIKTEFLRNLGAE